MDQVDLVGNMRISSNARFTGKFYLLIFLSLILYITNNSFFYSGYLRGHGLKYQTTLFPNGMFSSIYGVSMSHNDGGVLNMSMLTTYMENILYPNHVMVGGVTPCTVWRCYFYASQLRNNLS